MNWEAPLAADARLAARNAVKLRAALRNSLNSDSIYAAYLSTQPASSGNLAQDRARARAWAIINVRLNLEAFKLILLRIWATGYILGELAAGEILDQEIANKSALITKKETEQPKGPVGMGIDWSTWEPGDQITAALLKPKKGLQRLIGAQNVTIKDMTSTTLNQLGNALGEAVAMGMSARTASRHIKKTLAHPSRALMIAITESNRAMNYAAVDRYKEAGIQEMRWLVFDPCDICAQNANQVAPIGEPFKSGHIRPPAHPNCRCATAPIIPDFGQGVMGSVEEIPSPVPSAEPITMPTASDWENQPAQRQVMIDRMMEQRRKGYTFDSLSGSDQYAFTNYTEDGYVRMNGYLRGQRAADGYWDVRAKSLQKTIENAPKTEKPFVVFRAVRSKAATDVLTMNPGDKFHDAGFMSTSYLRRTAIGFAGEGNAAMFEITVPPGSKGLDVLGFQYNIDEFSASRIYNSEQEFLLQAGSTLEITSVDTDKGVIKAVLLPHG